MLLSFVLHWECNAGSFLLVLSRAGLSGPSALEERRLRGSLIAFYSCLKGYCCGEWVGLCLQVTAIRGMVFGCGRGRSGWIFGNISSQKDWWVVGTKLPERGVRIACKICDWQMGMEWWSRVRSLSGWAQVARDSPQVTGQQGPAVASEEHSLKDSRLSYMACLFSIPTPNAVPY